MIKTPVKNAVLFISLIFYNHPERYSVNALAYIAKKPVAVIPVKTGIQFIKRYMDTRFLGYDIDRA